MRKNERLISIRPYQTSTGDWHLAICGHHRTSGRSPPQNAGILNSRMVMKTKKASIA